MMMNFLKTQTLTTALVAAVFVSGCHNDKGPVEVTEVRVIDPENKLEMPRLATSSAERFRFSTKEPKAAPAPAPGSPRLVWDTPEGWKDAPGTQMRDANLTFGENGEGECYLTKLAGAGGGMAANVNRWRQQMGLPEMSAEDIGKLPKKPLFNQQATFISLDGDFGGMGGEGAKKDYRMLGLILTSQSGAVFVNGAVFVKMIGPKALVEANAAKFDAFCTSLDVDFGPKPETKK